ncbi:polar amino acid transport system substrate-binding protein [Crenobacter luteus]|uniref:Solute-binding protein family 3/N-terminal domain-containing protein n=1 Tax=Crenobacter luteus TaxID=1452487 RepID=A0A163B8G8_9NEIS|nr:hypothetical protein [Crenobacter luteus]KZE24987.1 hypothetical protein AVW16_04005 [Crenobacter luteus]TCP15087.1 polar amino acid transport system substrate-binding protein [Crenobacter luteus]
MWRQRAILCASLCVAAWTTPAAATPLRIAVFDPGPQDLAVETRLSAAYAKLGRRVEFVVLPGERALRATLAGATDGELMRVAGLEREHPQLVRVPVALAAMQARIYARRGSTFRADAGWEALRPYAFAYARGTRLIAERVAGMHGASPVDSVDQAFAMLAAHRVDLVVAERGDGEAKLRRLGLAQRVVVVAPALETVPLYHYLNRRHAALVPALTDALRRP